MKPCCKCKQVKKFIDFHKNKAKSFGLASECILCKKEYDKNNLNKGKIRCKKYRDSHPEIRKFYYENNKKIILEKQKTKYEANRKQFLKAVHYTNLQPLWIEEHKEKTKKDLICG